MERLLKSQNWTVALVIALCLGLMVLVLPRLSDKLCTIPLGTLIIAEYLFTLLVLVSAQFKSLRHSVLNLQLMPGLVSVGLIFLVSGVGIIVSPVAKMGTDGTVSLGLGQLTIMNLGILFLIFAIGRRDRFVEKDIVIEDSEAAGAKSTKIKRLTQIRIKAIGKTHEGLPVQESMPEAELEAMNEQMLQMPEPPIQPQSVSSPPSRLNQSTQGSVQRPKSTGQKSAHISAQQLMQKLQKPTGRQTVDSSTIEKPVIATSSADTQSRESTTGQLPPEINRLPKVQNNRAFDSNKSHSSITAKLQALSASGIGAANNFQAPNVAAGAEQTAGLRSVLDRLDSSEEVSTEISQPSTGQNEPIRPIVEQALFTRSVDKDMDNLFAAIVPTEAQREVSEVRGVAEAAPLATKGFAPAVPKSEASSPIIEKQPSEGASSGAPVFAKSVDKDIEEIFAGMTPAEAQREVSSARTEINAGNEISASSEVNPEPKVFTDKVDGQIEEIFAGMIPAEAQREVSSAKIEISARTEINTGNEISASSEIKEEPKVFTGKVDGQIEEIFAGMTPAQAQREVKDRMIVEAIKPAMAADASKENSNADEITGERAVVSKNFADHAVNEKGNLVPELKDFGRLSAKASAEHESSTQVGTMKTIGKLLIDSQSVENLIKRAESGKITVNLPSARVISLARGQGIQHLLESIDGCQGVEGSMLVGADGLVISSTYATAGDRDGTGVLTHGMLGNTNIAMLRFDLGKLEHMIMVGKVSENDSVKEVTTICTDVEVGMLAVFLDNYLLAGLDQLLETITTIAQG